MSSDSAVVVSSGEVGNHQKSWHELATATFPNRRAPCATLAPMGGGVRK